MYEHRNKLNSGFTAKYNVDWLVYFKVTDNIHVAIEREKQIKAWRRSKKVALIVQNNQHWEDLAASWFESAHEN